MLRILTCVKFVCDTADEVAFETSLTRWPWSWATYPCLQGAGGSFVRHTQPKRWKNSYLNLGGLLVR